MPGDRLAQGSAGDEKEAHALVARLDDDLVARAEHDQRPVADLVAHQDLVAVDLSFAQHAERFGRVREHGRALEDIGEGLAEILDLEALLLARRHGHVEIARLGGDAVDRTGLAPELAADDAHARAVVVDHLGDLGCGNVLVARLGHLEMRGQVRPQLEAVHAALGVAGRHFLMQDAAAGGHPLDVA